MLVAFLNCISLSLSEATAYIRHRLRVAGGSESIFFLSAIELIHQHAGGVPRLMNQLCDLALVYAFAERREHVNSALVTQMLKDRGQDGSVQPASEAGADAMGGGDAMSLVPSGESPVPLPEGGGLLHEHA